MLKSSDIGDDDMIGIFTIKRIEYVVSFVKNRITKPKADSRVYKFLCDEFRQPW